MSVVRTITRNVFSNFAGYFVSMVVGFLLTPYVLHQLGEEKWGLWTTIVAFTGSYGMLDLGIRSAVGHYVTRYWAQDDLEGVNRTFATSLVITGGIGILLVFVTMSIAFLSPLFLEVDGLHRNDLRIVILIMGIGVSVNFPLAVFGSAAYARQRFDIASGMGILERLASAAGYIWVLEQGWGLLGVACITSTVPTLANLLRLWIAFKLLPGLRLTMKLVKLISVKELFNFGTFNAFSNAADLLVIYSDTLIIVLVLNELAVAYYNIGSYAITQSMSLIHAMAWTLTPYATKLDTQEDFAGLRRLWITGTRVIVLVGSLLAGGMILLGYDFLSIWIRPDQLALVHGEKYTSGAVVMAVLAGTVLIRAAMSCGKQILFGVQEVRFLAKNSFSTALVNILLSVTLIYWFGILGVAIASVCSFAVMQLWFQPRFLAKRIDESVWAFLRPVLWIPCVVIGPMVAVDYFLCGDMVVDGWGSFVLKGFAVATPGLLTGMLFGLSDVEKDKLRAQLRRFLGGRDPFASNGH